MSEDFLSQGHSRLPTVRENENGDVVISQAGIIAVAEREKQEIQSAMTIAHRFPRDEINAEVKLLRSCENAEFAKEALYKFPRGGKDLLGPSIVMARESARLWGNIRHGLRIISDDDDKVQIKAYAFDLETNNYVEMEDKFAKLVQRKDKATQKTIWVKPDERDLRELINRRGAILQRNCLLQVIPAHVIRGAEAKVKETQILAARGELKKSRDETIKGLAKAFDSIQVTTDMIAKYLGHDLQLLNEEELTDLRRIYKSIADGNSKREEYFVFGEPSSAGPSAAVGELVDSLK